MTNKNLKKVAIYQILIFFSCLSALVLTSSGMAGAQDMAAGVLNADIKIRPDFAIVVDGTTITPDVPPIEKGGIIFIPLRFAAQALHAEVYWKPKEKTVQLIFPGNKRINMTIGQNEIDLGDCQKVLPVAPFLFENRAMIPLKPAAEVGAFRVEEKPNSMILTSEKEITGYTEPGAGGVSPGSKQNNALDEIKKKAHNDPITKSLRPYVLSAWAIAGILWLLITIFGITRKNRADWKDHILILFFLTAGVAFILSFMLSSYWAAIVVIGTCIIGMTSTETYTDKLVTMASSAQGFGLICTLFGLGLLIGPAIASRDIAAIGYGIYVKIEPTITGLTISILCNMLFGIEAKRMQD